MPGIVEVVHPGPDVVTNIFVVVNVAKIDLPTVITDTKSRRGSVHSVHVKKKQRGSIAADLITIRSEIAPHCFTSVFDTVAKSLETKCERRLP